MGVDLSGDLCVQACGCLGARVCVHVVVRVREVSVGAEGQEGGGRKKTEKGSDDKCERNRTDFLRGRKKKWQVYCLWCRSLFIQTNIIYPQSNTLN